MWVQNKKVSGVKKVPATIVTEKCPKTIVKVVSLYTGGLVNNNCGRYFIFLDLIKT